MHLPTSYGATGRNCSQSQPYAASTSAHPPVNPAHCSCCLAAQPSLHHVQGIYYGVYHVLFIFMTFCGVLCMVNEWDWCSGYDYWLSSLWMGFNCCCHYITYTVWILYQIVLFNLFMLVVHSVCIMYSLFSNAFSEWDWCSGEGY